MDSTDDRTTDGLNDDELERLIDVVIEQFGSTLDRRQFDEVVMALFDDLAGLESITTKKTNQYIAALWRCYRAKSN